VAGGEASVPVTGREDLEKGDGVNDVKEPGVQGKGLGKGDPGLPMAIGCRGAARNDAGSDRRLNKAEISAEFMGGLRWQSSQDAGCG
jgi:hypothetical protein